MRVRQSFWSSLLRSEIKKIIPSHLRLRAPAYILAALLLPFLLPAASTAFGGSATWNLNPDGLWALSHPSNWTPATTPNGPADTATFDVSNVTYVDFLWDDIEVNGIVFNPGASAFMFDVTAYNDCCVSLTISGVGITNNSGITQNFVVNLGPTYFSDLRFTNSATTGDLTVFTAFGGESGYVGTISFEDDSTADVARLEVFSTGNLDISAHNAPGVTVGSIEGSGVVFLGVNNLTVGSNSLNTTFSGVIQDGGSLTKVGQGTLILTNANTYAGGTTIQNGKLVVNNLSGSGTGSGVVQVNAGTLGGRGTITGAVTVGTGRGAGAVLAPGRSGGRPGDPLTIQSTLTFKFDATYEVGLNSVHAVADKVVAGGVTIDSGADRSPLFSFLGLGHGTLTPGTVFTVMDNTAATPIAGTFSNLADGSTFTADGNTFQVNYEGGTGNDLTLTVVP